ncbi:hypothetical protein BDW42DRAFT_166807 [Aspergillus taichungensis]|uniref:HNH nuclease domain-containing protein n=1 Tax=Aspergillus taichungensis TaxID=482145 RepID=A0A2J5HYA1_9EURO|nr:hypothetical protein BDW42DRAFT_166807 [Aspergillus taichungensis]
MMAHVHPWFDDYSVFVNPDDGYKISFMEDTFGLYGRILDPVCRDPVDPNRVSDPILRWLFRPSVLGNLRGPGEPSFEHDFSPSSDMLREIRQGPFSVERFEMELFARLRRWERLEDGVE